MRRDEGLTGPFGDFSAVKPGSLSRIASGKRKARDYGDRFIPTRDGSDLNATYHLFGETGSPTTPTKTQKRSGMGEVDAQKGQFALVLS